MICSSQLMRLIISQVRAYHLIDLPIGDIMTSFTLFKRQEIQCLKWIKCKDFFYLGDWVFRCVSQSSFERMSSKTWLAKRSMACGAEGKTDLPVWVQIGAKNMKIHRNIDLRSKIISFVGEDLISQYLA